MVTAERFNELMAALGWSRRGLAERLGLASATTVERWANGRATIPEPVAAWLERLAAPAMAEPIPPGWQIYKRDNPR